MRRRTGEAWASKIKNDPKSWGGESGKFGGGGGWMTGSYDPALNLVYWGTGNPAPDYDWGGARPGDNLYTSSVIALDPDTGQLKWHYQEIPHDDWDYDAGLGESLVMDRDGKKLSSTRTRAASSWPGRTTARSKSVAGRPPTTSEEPSIPDAS